MIIFYAPEGDEREREETDFSVVLIFKTERTKP
jgi:hypothetical protein